MLCFGSVFLCEHISSAAFLAEFLKIYSMREGVQEARDTGSLGEEAPARRLSTPPYVILYVSLDPGFSN